MNPYLYDNNKVYYAIIAIVFHMYVYIYIYIYIQIMLTYCVLMHCSGGEFKLTIKYDTTPTCSAVQWLEPAQTAGKKQPYLYTQCEVSPPFSTLGGGGGGGGGCQGGVGRVKIMVPWTHFVLCSIIRDATGS